MVYENERNDACTCWLWWLLPEEGLLINGSRNSWLRANSKEGWGRELRKAGREKQRNWSLCRMEIAGSNVLHFTHTDMQRDDEREKGEKKELRMKRGGRRKKRKKDWSWGKRRRKRKRMNIKSEWIRKKKEVKFEDGEWDEEKRMKIE